MKVLLTRKPGETGTRKEGYIAMGGEAYKAAGLEVATDIDNYRGENSVLYLPIRDGGKKFGASLEYAFKELRIPYLRRPAFVSKRLRMVLSPRRSRLAKSIDRLRMDRPGYGITAVIYDDTVDKGTRLLTMLDFMIDLQDDPRFHVDDIRLAACMDSKGITDHQSLLWTDELLDKYKALEDWRAETVTDRLAEALYSFLPTRMMDPGNVVDRTIVL